MVLWDFNKKIQNPRLSILKVMHEFVFCLIRRFGGCLQDEEEADNTEHHQCLHLCLNVATVDVIPQICPIYKTRHCYHCSKKPRSKKWRHVSVLMFISNLTFSIRMILKTVYLKTI